MWQFIRHLKIPLRKISKILHRAQDEMARNILEVPIIPGMSEVLRELKGLGHQIGIMTSNSKENVDALLQHNDLELFDFKLCSVKQERRHVTLSFYAVSTKCGAGICFMSVMSAAMFVLLRKLGSSVRL